jgi:type II secretory pathway component PulC
VKYSKILIFLGIGCVVGLLLVFGVRLQAQNASKKEIIIAKANEMKTQAAPQIVKFRNLPQGANWGVRERLRSAESDSSDFYKVIVDNNIFRPLGWRPPNREPQYTLIGTAINPNGTRVEAFISEERSNDFYIVGVGDKVGDAIVKEIQQKKVTLDKNGETITLRKGNMQFLKSGGSRRSSPSRSESSNRDESNNKGGSSKSFDKEAAMRKAKEEAMKKAQEMRGKFKGVPPEHREQIIRQLKERGILKGNSKVIVTFD